MRILHTLLILLGLLWTQSASATTWWVNSQYQADALKQYLEALWPDHPLTLQVGNPNGRGIWYEQGRLTIRHEDLIRRENMIWDYAQMITTVRGWMSTVRVDDTGWTPDWVAPSPPPTSPAPSTTQPPDSPPPFPATVMVQVGGAAHLRGTLTSTSPSIHLALEFPFVEGNLSVAPHIGMDVLQPTTPGLSADVLFVNTTYNRWTAAITGAWRLPIVQQRIEWFMRAGFRAYSAGNQRSFSTTKSPFVPAWTMASGLNLWILRTKAGEFGMGGAAEFDGRTNGLYVAGEVLSPYTFKGYITYHWGRTQKK